MKGFIMATCRDCFHWEACKAMAETMGFKISDDFHGSADRCKTFVNTADIERLTHLRRKNKKDAVADVPIQLSIFDKEDKNDEKENRTN